MRRYGAENMPSDKANAPQAMASQRAAQPLCRGIRFDSYLILCVGYAVGL